MGDHLTEKVKAEARRLGFQLVGVTTPEPPTHYDVYLSWLNADRHGEMGYLATERSRQCRADPRQILPGCKSILMVGMGYSNPMSVGSPADREPHGRVAAYAWGADYHEVIPARLSALIGFIEAQVGSPVPNRWYTDTAPILERDLAQRAGLGWIGKNTCLISPRLGSYFLLGEILLSIPLEADQPFVDDRCGSCTRCLEACPTGCILPDRTLDARRCISYLTIELKGVIPPELRPLMGEWIFGCDVCQQVCPWNQRFAPMTEDPVFHPRLGVPTPNLLEEIRLSPEAFNHKFFGSAVKRAKRRGYLRNVAVALGNLATVQGGEVAGKVVQALEKATREEHEPLVRAHAIWALEQIK